MTDWIKNMKTYWQAKDRQMTPEEIADTCEAAASLLEGNWEQGAWHVEKKGTYCIEGALGAVLNLNVYDLDSGDERNVLLDCPVHAAIVATLNEREEEGQGHLDARDLPIWNDRDVRVEQDVLDLLHATAKRVLGVEP